MLKIIDFVKGESVKGSIMQLEEKSFIACTGATSKTYKSEKGARKFMESKGYEEVKEVITDTVGNIVKVIR